MELKGRIFDIQRFSVHDGPGIRTTVFMKGCSLRCPWCHNPEGLDYSPTASFEPDECLGCGECRGEHTPENIKKCPVGAILPRWRDIEARDLVAELIRDRDFFGQDGGVTFSGGECLLQADFLCEALKLLKEEGINTAIDTSGAVPFSAFEKTLPYADLYLYDVKCADSALHERVIGKDNLQILANLKKLAQSGAEIIGRVPIIPDFNDNESELVRIANILIDCGIKRVTLIPYHTLGNHKYESLGLVPPYETKKRISKEKLVEFKAIFHKKQIFTD